MVTMFLIAAMETSIKSTIETSVLSESMTETTFIEMVEVWAAIQRAKYSNYYLHAL